MRRKQGAYHELSILIPGGIDAAVFVNHPSFKYMYRLYIRKLNVSFLRKHTFMFQLTLIMPADPKRYKIVLPTMARKHLWYAA